MKKLMIALVAGLLSVSVGSFAADDMKKDTKADAAKKDTKADATKKKDEKK